MSILDVLTTKASGALLRNKTLRNITMDYYENQLQNKIIAGTDKNRQDKSLPVNVALHRLMGGKAMFRTAINNYDRGIVSRKAIQKGIEIVVRACWNPDKTRILALKKYKEKYGIEPPLFMTFAPSKLCNLKCVGCYASSGNDTCEKLEYDMVEKIYTDLHDNFGMRFFVITGGEPLAYRSQGKTILDIPRKFPDSYFLMYTNGTLIDEVIAKDMADLGNITPAISLEGFEEETDCRRGKGTYAKIEQAFAHLKKQGVPFGISVTAIKSNIHILLDDKFYKHYFEDVGVGYMWMFQYMPIGRKFTTDLMITPEQRLQLFEVNKRLLEQKQWFIADFWNGAMMTHGCIACGKTNGYFYIDWNGSITPCVFVPYYLDNVKDLYAQGKSIGDAMFSPLFVEGRKWQESYYKKADGKIGNQLTPCFNRDNHKEFVEIIKRVKAKPEDKAAKEALLDPEYHKALYRFDTKLKSIMDPYWEKNYSETAELKVPAKPAKKSD